jgi:hypothetical protein
VEHGAHLRRVLGLDRVGVVPEVEPVHVAVVEPQTDVVRMVDALPGARVERKAARDERAVRGADGIEDRLLERGRPDVRGERLAVDRDVDPLARLVDDDLDAARAGERQDEPRGGEKGEDSAAHGHGSL